MEKNSKFLKFSFSISISFLDILHTQKDFLALLGQKKLTFIYLEHNEMKCQKLTFLYLEHNEMKCCNNRVALKALSKDMYDLSRLLVLSEFHI